MSDLTIDKPFGLSAEEVLEALRVQSEQGLTSSEAQARLEQFGRNELPEEPPDPAWRKFINQFRNPLTYLLLAATVISFIAWLIEHESPVPYESLTILAIVILNAVLGYVQEFRAEQAVAALQAMAAPTARLLRDGQPQVVPANLVVPGDILLIEEGDTIPADGRVIESIAMQAAEAALTGESTPVSKDRHPLPADVSIGDQVNMVFSSTAITMGRGRAVITTTGSATEIGKIAGSLQATPEEPTPLQKELDSVGRMLGRIVIVIAILMALTLFIINSGQHSLTQVVDILLLAVSLAVAAVPEGLTAITTIVLSLGMNRMAERNVIVRKLNAVETLGSTTVICSDKTGTLTKNEMTVRTVVIPQGRVSLEGIGYNPQGRALQNGEPFEDPELLRQVQRILRSASLASNARLVESGGNWSIQGDPTEGALLVAARKVGITDEMLAERFTRVGEVPFTSERKMMSIALQDSQREDHLTVTAKGAPDVLLGLCTRERFGPEEVPLTPARRDEILGTIDALAREALRTIGVAYRHIHRDEVSDVITDVDEKDLVFLGVVGMIDPPRPEAAQAVRVAAQAGIRTIMITGDHPTTAGAIARELAITAPGDKTMSGYELEKTDEASLATEVQKISVFARVAPEHKLRIVRALKLNGAIVAMTGDGVNDAPALKAADIGVAMGITGTDVSKGAADMILTDDNFASIVAAVEEGRSIFANIQKFLLYLLSSNIGEVLVMFFGVLLAGVIGLTAEEGVGIIVPLLATQILWINLLTDAGPALALGVDPAEPGVMARSPRDPGKPVITPTMWYEIGFIGVIMGIGTLLVMDWSLPGGLIHQPGGSLPYAHTMAFTTLVFYQLYNSFNARSERESAFRGVFKNRWLWLAVAISALLQVLVIYTPFLQKPFGTVPLTASDWFVCLAVGSTILWLRELLKFFQRRRDRLARTQ